MQLPRAPKAVIFDMDGLMIDTVPAYLQAMIAASDDVGYRLPRDYFLSLVGLLGRELQARMVHDLGGAFPIAAFTTAMCARLEPLLRASVALKPGAAELIDALARAGLPIAVATSMKKADALHHLEMHDLKKYFAHVVASDDVANGKPHPDIHIKAASELGLAPCDCLVLEDSFNGGQGGACGWRHDGHGSGCRRADPGDSSALRWRSGRPSSGPGRPRSRWR